MYLKFSSVSFTSFCLSTTTALVQKTICFGHCSVWKLCYFVFCLCFLFFLRWDVCLWAQITCPLTNLALFMYRCFLNFFYCCYFLTSCSKCCGLASLPPAHPRGGQYIWRLFLWSATGIEADQCTFSPGDAEQTHTPTHTQNVTWQKCFHSTPCFNYLIFFFFSWSSLTWSRAPSAPPAFTTSAPPSTTHRRPWWASPGAAYRTLSSSATVTMATSPTSS